MTDHRCARGPRCALKEKITDRPALCDECECHGHGPDWPCSVLGGCGHLHVEVDTWVGWPIETETGLCRMCADHVGQAIAHLPLDMAELTVLMASNSRAGECERVVSTPDAAIPIRVNLEALRAEIDDQLQAWAEPVAEELGIDWRTAARQRSRIGHRAQAAAKLLAVSVPTLLAVPVQEHPAWTDDGLPAWAIDLESDPGPGAWVILERSEVAPYEVTRATTTRTGLDGALRLMELHRRAYVAAGRTRLVHRLSGPCPWCSERTLTRENGASEVICESSACRGRPVPERYYDWLAAVVTAEEKRLRAAA